VDISRLLPREFTIAPKALPARLNVSPASNGGFGKSDSEIAFNGTTACDANRVLLPRSANGEDCPTPALPPPDPRVSIGWGAVTRSCGVDDAGVPLAVVQCISWSGHARRYPYHVTVQGCFAAAIEAESTRTRPDVTHENLHLLQTR
jgi:hypothetical protein